MMTEADALAALDFDPDLSCDVRDGGNPCKRRATLVLHGACPQCDSAKPRDFAVCKPCWDKLSRLHMRCHRCGTAAPATSFYSVTGRI